MGNFFKNLSAGTAALLTGIISTTALVYNNERTINSNNKTAELNTKMNEIQNLLLKNIDNRLENLEKKLENNSQISDKDILELRKLMEDPQFKDKLMSAYKDIVENSKTELEENINTSTSNSLNQSDLNTVDNLNVSKSSVFDIDSIISTVSEPGFITFSICILLFSFVTVSSTLGLISNYYFDKYGDQYKEKLPKWLLPYIKVRKNINNYTNKYYIFMILASQSMTVLICIYLKFRGIA